MRRKQQIKRGGGYDSKMEVKFIAKGFGGKRKHTRRRTRTVTANRR